MRRLLAGYPRGAPSGITSTPDGKILYAGEGGTVSIIDADPTSPNAQANYRYPIKRVAVGHQGVVPVHMILDPDAQTIPGKTSTDLLYVAGGRDGLWVMEADATDPQFVNKAWRVDDKGNQRNLMYQRSRKWCDDVAIVTLGKGTDKQPYLLALFGRQSSSHLCLYPLSSVRAVALAPEETGAEIQPEKFLSLKKHTNTSIGGFSFAFAMAVDEHYDAQTDNATAHVYVAMGQHGLVRVLVERADSLLQTTVEWGPVFGDGSPYAAQDPDLYSNLNFRNGPGGAIERSFPPHFVDVAIDHRASPNHRLYAAVDHLGFVSFDLDVPWTDFIYPSAGQQAPLPFHQEGRKTSDAWGKFGVTLIDDPNPDLLSEYQFARNLEVVETTVAGAPSAALVVGTHPSLFVAEPWLKNHGRNLDFLGRGIGGLPGYLTGATSAQGGFKGKQAYALVYDLGDAAMTWTSNAIHAAGFTRLGDEIHVFEEQAPDSLSFYANGRIDDMKLTVQSTGETNQNLGRVDYSASSSWPWPPQPIAHNGMVLQREAEFRRGRWTYKLAPSLVNGNLLMTGFNDAGLVHDGPLVLDLETAGEPAIKANFDKDPLAGQTNWQELNRHGANGLDFEPRGAIVQNGFEYRFAYAKGAMLSDAGVQIQVSGVDQFEPVWRVSKFEVGTDIYSSSAQVEPSMVNHIFFRAPYGKFKTRGRHYYSGGYISQEYNDWVAAHVAQPKRYAFMTVNSTPNGLWVLDMDAMIARLEAESTPGETFYLGQSANSGLVVGELTTHPEWWNVPDARADSSPPEAEHFAQNQLDDFGTVSSNLITMYPRIFKLPAPGSQTADTWVMAVPCGTSYCDENYAGFAGHPDWEPNAPFRTDAGNEHVMVRVFDISDPTKFSKGGSTAGETGSFRLPGYTILGFPSKSATFDLEHLEVVDSSGKERHFLFIANYGGSLEVTEITDLLSLQPDLDPLQDPSYLHYGAVMDTGYLFARHDTLPSLSNDLPTSAFGVAIDKHRWKDASQVVHEDVWVYLSVARVGVEVLKFDVNGTTNDEKLIWTDLIQTPGETSFIHLWEENATQADNPVIRDLHDEIGWVTDPEGIKQKKLLFVGDGPAGFRIYTYEEGQ